MMYSPKPINTSKIELSKELNELIELLAENNHDIWAKQRIQDGWSYGSSRNDSEKKHPDLVPYNELSEEEKIYDRNSAAETIKAIIFLGFRINKVKE